MAVHIFQASFLGLGLLCLEIAAIAVIEIRQVRCGLMCLVRPGSVVMVPAMKCHNPQKKRIS